MEVHRADCTSLAEFTSLVAPLTMSRHMTHFFAEKTYFSHCGVYIPCSVRCASDNGEEQSTSCEARYLTSGTQIVALWISTKIDFVRVSYGTYVERAYRRKGLASLLWSHETLDSIQGTSCSTAGYRFLSALKQKRRNITFVDCRQA